MLRTRVTQSLTRRTNGTRASSSRSSIPRSNTPHGGGGGKMLLFLVGGGGGIGVVASYLVLNNNHLEMKSERVPTSLETRGGALNDGKLRLIPMTFLWGRNTDLVVSPPSTTTSSTTSSSSEFVKKPLAPKSLTSLVLRDLKLSKSFGVAIDSKGDVLQWGLGFSSTGMVEYTLKGKDILKIETTEQGKVFGIDKKGQVWVWSSDKLNQTVGGGLQREQQLVTNSDSNSNSLWWLGQGTVWGRGGGGAKGQAIECLKLSTDSILTKGEKFISISCGQSHLLALTSSGRSFALPLCLAANDYGQLGVRNVSLLSSSVIGPLKVRLEPDEKINEMARDRPILPPKNLDPLLLNPNTTMPTRNDPQPQSQTIHPLPQPQQTKELINLHPTCRQEHDRLERSISFCTLLHEIPSLRNVQVVELVAGRNHTLARLGGRQEGRVLGFGAGAYGQLGLGPSLSFPSIPTPTEIPFLRSPAYSSSKPTSAKCVKLSAGGNLSYFVVETEKPGKTLGSSTRKEIDLLACGQGQFGGLGNGLWAHATHPLRVKTVSGLTEWNEEKGKVEPIGIKDIQAGETHVAVVLDNAVTFPDGSKFGRDVFTFGQNEFYQLGNGKRASLATPQHLPPLPYPSASLKTITIDENGEKIVIPVKQEESLSSGTTSPMPHKRLQLATDLPVPKGLPKKTVIEETVVTGDSSSGVYWKIVS